MTKLGRLEGKMMFQQNSLATFLIFGAFVIVAGCATTQTDTTQAALSPTSDVSADDGAAKEAASETETKTVADAAAVETDPKDEVVCKQYKITGSNLRRKRLCKTRQQWDDDRAASRRAIDDLNSREANPLGSQ